MTAPRGESQPTHAGHYDIETEPGDHLPVQVEVVSMPEFKQSASQSHFSTTSLLLIANQIYTVAPNPYRKRLVIFTDAANTANVYIAAFRAALLGNTPPFQNAIALAAASGQIEFTHTAQLDIMSTAAATVYMFEERYVP